MTTFTIDEQNNITAHGSPEEAAAANTTPFDSFSSQQELAELVAGWPAERLVAIWNSLPGVAVQGPRDGHQPDVGTHPGTRRVRQAEGGT